MTKQAHSSHFIFKIFAIEIYVQKSPVEWHSQHLNHQKARLRRHLGFFYLGTTALGICLQSGSAISMCGAHE